MKKIIILLGISFLVFNISAQTINEKLSTIVEKYANDSLLNGSILIAKNNDILYQNSFGAKKIDEIEYNSDSTLYAIGSVTKQFTSAAILILKERKVLSIDDKISKYFEVTNSMENITIKNLLNHTSGILDYWNYDISHEKDTILHFIFDKDTLEFETGTKHLYCNSGYFLLGQIIENVSGMSYGEFLKTNIFEPLNMSNTFLFDGNNYDRAIGYNENWTINDYLITSADGGIISTVEDLYLWDKALLENKLLSVNSKELMFKPFELPNNEIVNYGFGWDVNENNRNIVSHTGWLSAFGAYNQLDKETGCFFILLSNQIRPELMDLINEVNSELYKTE